MTKLSSEARAIADAGKNVFQPTSADHLRITQALAERIGAATLGVSSSTLASPSLVSGHAFATLAKVVGAVGLVALAGTYYLPNRKAPTSPSPRNAVVVQPSAVPQSSHAQAQSPVTTPEAVEPASIQPAQTEQPPRVTRSRGDSLGEEVAILTLAGKELRNGRPAAALKALDEHQRRFPSGALAQERTASRIQALCALGQTSQAAAESAKLPRTSLGSPQLSLTDRPCAPR